MSVNRVYDASLRGTDVEFDVGLLVLPAVLALGAPNDPAPYEKGLFCETVELVEAVVVVADRGGDPRRAVEDINRKSRRRSCIYSMTSEIRARTVKFEKNIAANHSIYSIYQVEVTTLGYQKTEAGDLDWTLSQPLIMYTLRDVRPDHQHDH